jgi:hypothetical protein
MTKSSAGPTEGEIDELLAFAPRLRALDGRFIEDWGGGEKRPDDVFTMPWPRYPKVVSDFFEAAAKPCWSDRGYVPTDAGIMISDSLRIDRASLEELRTMLTWCVRGERFCDGHWDAVLCDGKIFALLERLSSIRNRGSAQG